MTKDQNITAQTSEHKLKLRLLEGCFGVCRLQPSQPIPEWALSSKLYSITKTLEELSVVCSLEIIPGDVACEGDWRMLKIEGPLDFSLVGILSAISTVLAKQEISIFAISTYDTDYILIKDHNTHKAVMALTKEGYEILE